jgi:hypothetical protein
MVKQYLAKEENENDEGREELAKEAGKALKRLTAEGVQHGFANISIVVYADTESELEDSVSEVVGTLTNAGFGAIREKTNLMPAWNSTLPGRWDKQRRLQFVETPAVSDIAPVRSVLEGPIRNAWLSEDRYRGTAAHLPADTPSHPSARRHAPTGRQRPPVRHRSDWRRQVRLPELPCIPGGPTQGASDSLRQRPIHTHSHPLEWRGIHRRDR